jgi:hypothetical protein
MNASPGGRRRFMLGMVGRGLSRHVLAAPEGETLYNGIERPSPFPPRKDSLTLDPPAPLATRLRKTE